MQLQTNQGGIAGNHLLRIIKTADLGCLRNDNLASRDNNPAYKNNNPTSRNDNPASGDDSDDIFFKDC
ncbi:MAG: hypothetical protein LBI58_06160 [Tannerellaceae bacterium]|nr:hypothetical protein [Tannerellaceae bacterium]